MIVPTIDGKTLDIGYIPITRCPHFVRTRPVVMLDGVPHLKTTGWCITHIPTGKVCYFLFNDPKTAEQFATELEALGDWGTTEPSDVLLDLGHGIGWEYVASGDAVRMQWNG